MKFVCAPRTRISDFNLLVSICSHHSSGADNTQLQYSFAAYLNKILCIPLHFPLTKMFIIAAYSMFDRISVLIVEARSHTLRTNE